MAEIGLSAHVQADVSAYQSQIRVLGIRLPMRVAKALGGAIAAAIAIGLYFVLALGLPVDAVSFMFPLIGACAFVYGFWQHKGLPPEVFLPEWLGNKLRGKRLVRISPDRQREEGARKDPEVRSDKKYRKQAKKARGARCAEIYIPRVEAAKARYQEEGKGAEAGR